MKTRHLIMALIAYSFMGWTSVWAMSPDKCRTNDWFAVGRDWGFKGEPEDKIVKNQQVCQKKGVEIAITEYKKGWQMGIGQYCNPDNAYKLGFAKKRPSKNCPIELKPAFDQFYGWGKDASKVEKEIKASENKLKNKKREMDNTERKLNKLQSEVKSLEKSTTALKEKVSNIEKEMAQKRLQYKSTVAAPGSKTEKKEKETN